MANSFNTSFQQWNIFSTSSQVFKNNLLACVHVNTRISSAGTRVSAHVSSFLNGVRLEVSEKLSDYILLRFYSVYSGRRIRKFRRNMLLPCARSCQQNFHWSAGIRAQDCTRRHKRECHTFSYSHNFTYLFHLWLFLVYLTTVEVLLLTQCRTVIPKSARKASWIPKNPSVNIADLRIRSRTRDFRNINLLSYPFCTDVRLITFCKVFRDWLRTAACSPQEGGTPWHMFH